jgi:activating signal cointegrator 1
VKIFTLYQPWATLIALRIKNYETRAWGTRYRGLIAIHAAKCPVKNSEIESILHGAGGCSIKLEEVLSQNLPLGAIVGVAELTDCQIMSDRRDPRHTIPEAYAYIGDQTALEIAVGDWRAGRCAWKLENILALPTPIPYRGYQGLRGLDPVIVQQIERCNGLGVG